MSKLDELIKEFCLDGVEYNTLGELGKFYGGLTGKSKEDSLRMETQFLYHIKDYDYSDYGCIPYRQDGSCSEDA